MFSPTPEIVHRDRTDFRGFMHHQYGWGLHTYLVQWGERTHGLPIRLAIATIFLLAAPGYAALATWLNMRPWLAARPRDWWPIPAVYLCYLYKTVAIVHGTLRPTAASRGCDASTAPALKIS